VVQSLDRHLPSISRPRQFPRSNPISALIKNPRRSCARFQ
jgi:hypothetical protein